MKWFMHEGNARSDSKIEKLLIKYGVEGYGLYFYCVEIIAGNLSSDNITFDLKHDAETIAYRLKMDTLRVEEIMKWMVENKLFQFNDATGRIMCLGLLKRLDVSTSNNPEFKKIKADSKKLLETNSNYYKLLESNSRREENRIEENRTEEREQPKEDTLPKKVKHPGTGLAMSATRYSALCDKHGAATVDDYMERIQLYCESKPRKPYADAAATAATWIRKDIDKGTFRGIQSYDYDEDIKKKTAYFGAKD